MVMPQAVRVLAAVIGGFLVLIGGVQCHWHADCVAPDQQPPDPLGRLAVDRAYQVPCTRPGTSGGATGCSPPRRRPSCSPAGGLAGRRVRRVRPAAVAVRRARRGVRLRRRRVLDVHPGLRRANGAVPAVIVFLAAAVGLVIITLQIAYLPTLYAAFNRRETEVALLNARGGFPSWGPELLARTHYALGTDMSSLDTMGDLYTQWERWAADVAESHTTYLQLVRFRSPQPLSSWVTSLLGVLDSAALFLALSPKAAPEIPARLCLRGRLLVLQPDRQGDGVRHPPGGRPGSRDQPDLRRIPRRGGPDARGRLPDRARTRGAWPDFVGWRINYERAAYAVAAAIYAAPAIWSGPRRHPTAADPAHPAAPRPAAHLAGLTPLRAPGLAGAGRRPGWSWPQAWLSWPQADRTDGTCSDAAAEPHLRRPVTARLSGGHSTAGRSPATRRPSRSSGGVRGGAWPARSTAAGSGPQPARR